MERSAIDLTRMTELRCWAGGRPSLRLSKEHEHLKTNKGTRISVFGVSLLLNRLGYYEELGLTPERVAELAAAECEGRLVVLECAVGSTVYAINPTRGFISEMIIDAVKVYDTGGINYFWKAATDETIYTNMVGFYGAELGKTVFATREEAEAALSALRDKI